MWLFASFAWRSVFLMLERPRILPKSYRSPTFIMYRLANVWRRKYRATLHLTAVDNSALATRSSYGSRDLTARMPDVS